MDWLRWQTGDMCFAYDEWPYLSWLDELSIPEPELSWDEQLEEWQFLVDFWLGRKWRLRLHTPSTFTTSRPSLSRSLA
jgi:hypothetical protein